MEGLKRRARESELDERVDVERQRRKDKAQPLFSLVSASLLGFCRHLVIHMSICGILDKLGQGRVSRKRNKLKMTPLPGGLQTKRSRSDPPSRSFQPQRPHLSSTHPHLNMSEIDGTLLFRHTTIDISSCLDPTRVQRKAASAW
jgi:hypothetical protein